MVKRYPIGVVTGKLKQRGVPVEKTGYVILGSILDNQSSHSSVYMHNNSRKFMSLESRALYRDINRFIQDLDSIDSVTLPEPQAELLAKSPDIYTVQYMVHVPFFLTAQNYKPDQIVEFMGEQAYEHLSHCGSRKVNPADPKSAYAVFLNHLRTQLETQFNTKLTPK